MNRQMKQVFASLLFLGAALGLAQTGSGDKQAQFDAHLRKAESYLREKRPDLAIPELQIAVSIEPESVETQANLGVLLFFQGKTVDAIPHLRAAVALQPALSKIQGILGLAELHAQKTAQGRKDLEAAFPSIEETKFKVRVGLELVSSYTESGDLERAAGILDQLRKAAPENPEVLYAAYRTYSDLSGAARLALSVVAPDSAQMHQLLAHEEIKEGNTNRAIDEFRKAIAIDTRLPDVHYELAELLHTSSDPAIKKEAIDEYRIALEQNPEDERTIRSLAEIDARNGKTQQAHAEYAQAVQLEPDDAQANLGLAGVLITMGQDSQALPYLEDAVRLEPTDPTAHYRLGMLYRKMGRVEEARREIDLFKKYKEMKEKLRAVYKNLLIQPKEIRMESEHKSLPLADKP